MSKSPEMEAVLENLGLNMFGRSRAQSASNGTCVTCGGDATEFRDELSRREYGISRMCQRCQDSVFNQGDDE